MVSALMPESLYRNEFGGDQPDDHDRKNLTPRETSYALTDKIPQALR